jgi:hypothetical protein
MTGICSWAGDLLDGGLGDPAFLLLGQPQHRDHRRLLALGGVLGFPPIGLGLALDREREAGGLFLG